VDDLEFLNKSHEFDKPGLDFDSVHRENKSLRAQSDQSLLDLKTDNLIMREKVRSFKNQNLIFYCTKGVA